MKEDAVSEEDCSMSDSTKNEKREEDEVKTEKESSDGMEEVTEAVDSEQPLTKRLRKVRRQVKTEEALYDRPASETHYLLPVV